jgi:ABC-type antimicrobial peptide transport system permease subunit
MPLFKIIILALVIGLFGAALAGLVGFAIGSLIGGFVGADLPRRPPACPCQMLHPSRNIRSAKKANGTARTLITTRFRFSANLETWASL